MSKSALAPNDIERWLVDQLAKHLGVLPGEVDPTMSFADLGLDSISAVEIASKLQAEWDLALTETAMWDYPTIRDLATYLVTSGVNAAEAG